MLCLIYVLLFLRQLPGCIQFRLEEKTACHLIREQLMEERRPLRNTLVSCLNLCNPLATKKRARPCHTRVQQEWAVVLLGKRKVCGSTVSTMWVAEPA